MPITVRQVTTEAEFDDYFYLRWKILRKPWQQARGSEKDADEEDSIHIIGVKNQQIIAVARLQTIAPQQLQLRYMAVDTGFQKRGAGKALLLYAENYAKEHNFAEILLHARENARGFYLHLGYAEIEKSYLLFDTIQHYKMIKYL